MTKKKDSPEEVVAALRELMHLGPNDPVPAPPAASAEAGKKANDDKKDDKKEEKNVSSVTAVTGGQ